MERSEEAYKRFRGKQSISKIAKDMDVRRGTVAAWIDKEMNERDETHSLMRRMKKLLGVIE